MLSSTSWAHLNTLLRSIERRWVLLSQLNLKLVKLFAQHGSTFSLFCGHPCVAQQSRVQLHSNAQHVEPAHAQCPAYPKIAMVDLHRFLVACSVLDHELFDYVVVASFTAPTPNPCSCFTTSFFALLSSLMSSLTRSAAKHFRVLRGWIYLKFPAMIQYEPLWNIAYTKKPSKYTWTIYAQGRV